MSGDLDTSFGTVGFVVTDFGLGNPPPGPNVNKAFSVATQTDGKIILGGYTYDYTGTNTNHFTMARYNTNGSLDTTFGSGGLVITSNFATSSNDQCFSIAIQSDGKILMCGQTTAFSTLAVPYSFVLARYTTNGSLDTSFGAGTGYILTNFSLINSQYGTSTANSLVIQTNGYIVLGGSCYRNASGANGFALARYDTIGNLDTSFGSGGVVVTGPFSSGNNSIGHSVALQSNGYIILGGQIFSGSVYDFGIARYDTQGNLDATFANSGIFQLNIPTLYSVVSSVKVQTNGYIAFGGTVSDPISGIVPTYWLLGRLNTSGVLDSSFGTGGTVSTSLTSPSTLTGNSLAIQTDGKIILGGTYNINNSSSFSFALARYNTNGTLDTSFGSAGNGLILTDLIVSPSEEYGVSLAIQTDGKILLGGYGGPLEEENIFESFILARYLNFTTPTPTPTPITSICFPAGTPILTDQGNIVIEQINPEIHTIHKKPIMAITQSIMNEDKIVCIERHSLGINIPNKRTYISNYHGIMYNNKLTPAKQLVGRLHGVYYKKYEGEILYNVLMEKHYYMNVNNMKVETLNPKNIVAKLYTGNYNEDEKLKIILEINEQSKNNIHNLNNYKKYNGYNGYENITHNITRRRFAVLRYNPFISKLNFHTKKHFSFPNNSYNKTIKNNAIVRTHTHKFRNSRLRR
jgi:uncharacterized delta-60 repeat protein